MRLVNRIGHGHADGDQPEPCKDSRIGGCLSRRSDGTGGAVSCGFDVTGEVVMTKWQQRGRHDIQREHDLQPQADGPPKEPSRCAHLHFDYTGRFGSNAKA
jgi:hypothetical protein